MTLRCCVALLMLIAVPGLAQEGKKSPKNQVADSKNLVASIEAYKALTRDYDAALEEFQKAYQKAKTFEEKQKVFRDTHPRSAKFAPRFLTVAQRYPTSPIAVECLLWVVRHPILPPPARETDPRSRALKLLQTDYLNDERLGRLCTELVYTLDEGSEEFLRTVLDKATLPGVLARACTSLAVNLKQRGRLIQRLKNDPTALKAHQDAWGKPTIAALLKRDADSLLEESVKLFLRVIDRYGDVKHPRHGTLSALARANIAAIQKPVDLDLTVPEIDLPDVEGKPLKLSDLRGKVVLIDFWAHSFPACQGMYQYQRNLVKRLAGKPFVLVGVNADADKQAVRKVMAEEKLTWRSWWDGGGVGGPIATRWEIDLWPSVVLIDHKGVVRAFYSGWPEPKTLDAEIDKLVKQAQTK